MRRIVSPYARVRDQHDALSTVITALSGRDADSYTDEEHSMLDYLIKAREEIREALKRYENPPARPTRAAHQVAAARTIWQFDLEILDGKQYRNVTVEGFTRAQAVRRAKDAGLRPLSVNQVGHRYGAELAEVEVLASA